MEPPPTPGTNFNRNLLNISFSSALVTSTPSSKRKGKGKPRTFVRPVCDVCEYCQKEYRCHHSYFKHVREHKIKETAAAYPNVNAILEHLKNNISTTLKEMGNLPAFGEVGARFKNLLTALSSNDLSRLKEWNEVFDLIHSAVSDNIGTSKVLLPSALITVLQRNVENFLSDVAIRNFASELVQVLAPCDKSTAHQFICDYVVALILKVIQFISTSMRENMTRSAVLSKEIELDVEDLEIIHYVAGSTIRTFYKKSLLFPKNPGWNMIGNVITQRLLESDSVSGPPQIVKGWTIAQNRGRLFFVSDVIFNFFVV